MRICQFSSYKPLTRIIAGEASLNPLHDQAGFYVRGIWSSSGVLPPEQSLLKESQQLLQSSHDTSGEAWGQESEESIRKLLRLSVGLQKARAPGITDQLLQVVMRNYRARRDQAAKAQFLNVICQDFGIQFERVREAAEAYQLTTESGQNENSVERTTRAIRKLQAACQPQYASLFVPISNQPGGIKFLSDLRADVDRAARDLKGTPAATHLKDLSDSLKASLSEWFSVGLLRLEELSWERSTPALLEKAIEYEQVHFYDKQNPWRDLKRRVSSNKRLYGFFHGSMPDEPLVLLYTALMPDITASLDDILKHERSVEGATAAVFYSINSTQKGLAGIDLGNFLIKQAAIWLMKEHPHITQLSTLSPIPGFSRWWLTSLDHFFLSATKAGGFVRDIQYKPEEEKLIQEVWRASRGSGPGNGALSHDQAHAETLDPNASENELSVNAPSPTSLSAFEDTLTTRIQENGSEEKIWKPLLMHLVARYLLLEKRRNFALDPVANFHLRNGAELWRINYKACAKGESFGMMVNYKYNLRNITRNNQAYIHNGVIEASDQVRQLAECKLSPRVGLN